MKVPMVIASRDQLGNTGRKTRFWLEELAPYFAWERSVTRITSSMILIISAMLVVFGSIAIAAQDKYTLKLGQLSFADFRGYENWKNVAVSQTEKQLKVILANDLMIDAYKRGLPADGTFFPDGVKIVKIEWSFKKNPVSPYFVQVPDVLRAVDVIEKDTKRFPNTHGWAYANFVYDAASDTFAPEGTEPTCGFACHTTVASKDYIFTEYPKH